MHPSTEQLYRWFDHSHLPEHLQEIVSPFEALAKQVADRGGGQECTAALRKLLEAKDCAVRAAICKGE